MSLVNVAVSTLTQVVVLALIPFLCYRMYHRWRHSRSATEVAERLGLRIGQPSYIFYAAIIALATIVLIALWEPALEPFYREGLALEQFAEAELTVATIVAALLYGFFRPGLLKSFCSAG